MTKTPFNKSVICHHHLWIVILLFVKNPVTTQLSCGWHDNWPSFIVMSTVATQSKPASPVVCINTVYLGLLLCQVYNSSILESVKLNWLKCTVHLTKLAHLLYSLSKNLFFSVLCMNVICMWPLLKIVSLLCYVTRVSCSVQVHRGVQYGFHQCTVSVWYLSSRPWPLRTDAFYSQMTHLCHFFDC